MMEALVQGASGFWMCMHKCRTRRDRGLGESQRTRSETTSHAPRRVYKHQVGTRHWLGAAAFVAGPAREVPERAVVASGDEERGDMVVAECTVNLALDALPPVRACERPGRGRRGGWGRGSMWLRGDDVGINAAVRPVVVPAHDRGWGLC